MKARGTSILQPWVTELGLRHQGVLLTAVRGCDGVAKHDVSKPVMRAIRATVLVPFDDRELTEPKGFIYFEHQAFKEGVEVLAKNLDEYPVHFVFHVIHALEVIGYKHPLSSIGYPFLYAYRRMVEKFHLNTETREQLDTRLCEDRVKNGTVAG